MIKKYSAAFSAFALIIVALPLFAIAGQDQTAEGISSAVKAASEAVSPCIVSIQPIGGEETSGKTLVSEVTTGVFVSPEGYIITSLLGFDPAPASIIVRLPDGQIKAGKLAALDYIHKLALIKIQSDKPCPVPSFLPKSQCRVGQWTVACGRVFLPDKPGAAPINVTVGILSALSRVWGRAVQTDAAISPNNYGGPLVDLQGRVIGIISPLSPESDEAAAGVDWYDSGIGFAVPWESIQAALPRLIKDGNLKPGFGGFGIEEPNPAIAAPILVEPPKGTPTEKAGLKKGDRIISADGKPTETYAQFRCVTASKAVGDSVEIQFRRTVKQEGKEIEKTFKTTVTLGEPSEKKSEGILPGLLNRFKQRQKDGKPEKK